MLQEFKKLVDSAPSKIVSFTHDHYKVAEYLNIDNSTGYSRQQVVDKLSDRIKNISETAQETSFLSNKETVDLADALVYESVLSDVDNSYYLTILKILQSKQKMLFSFDNKSYWEEILVCCADYEAFNPDCYTIYHLRLRHSYPKQFDIANAALKLRELGCEVVLENLVLSIKSGLEEIVVEIESEIADMGSELFLKIIFNHLVTSGNFYPAYQRYLIFNQLSTIPYLTKPMIPYGYLINLAIKHNHEPKNPRQTQKDLQKRVDRIISKATHLGCIVDVRHYGSFEIIFQAQDKIPELVTKLALFDSAFSFPSSNLVEVIELMDHLFRWVDRKRFIARFGFSIEQVIELTKCIDEMSADNGPQILYLSKLKKALPEMATYLPELLKRFSHAYGWANEGYEFLNDYEKLDFGFRPLLQLSETKYMLCDKSWCAAAFYEVMASLVRELDINKDESNSKIGTSLETYIYHKFKESNISLVHGQYTDDTTPAGEADGLIETSQSIVLLEIKKKVLTRKAKSGSDLQLITDLASSLLDAQFQAGRTELLLRGNGFVDLVQEDSTTVRVNFQDKQIERIALTQWDYGSFQDRSVINKVLSSFAEVQLGLFDESDKSMMKTFKKINKKCAEWGEQASELRKADPSFDHFPFFNCWFLSLPQLVTMLRYCKSNEDFFKALVSTKHVTLSSSNFYYEFYQMFVRKKLV